MARNMWTFLDRELAKLEQQTSGDPYVDAIKEARQLHKEQCEASFRNHSKNEKINT